jgi:hypothetical protein
MLCGKGRCAMKKHGPEFFEEFDIAAPESKHLEKKNLSRISTSNKWQNKQRKGVLAHGSCECSAAGDNAFSV